MSSMSKNCICHACQGAISLTRKPDSIIVHGAREHNLKNICFELPKGKLIVLTGPSGSGKSSIATDVLQRECLREYFESLGMVTDHLAKANVDTIMGLSPSLGVAQRAADFNPRSTIGTRTGILTILRNMFAAMGYQLCGGCGEAVKQPLQDAHKLTAVEIQDENSKKKKTKQYFDCPLCGHQLEKLIMAHFSFNALAGACEECKGVGENMMVDLSRLLHEEKALRDGGVDCWNQAIAKHYEGVILAASRHYGFAFDLSSPLRDYTKEQRDFLLYGITFPEFVRAHKGIKQPQKASGGNFEGIAANLLSRYKKNPENPPSDVAKYIVHEQCTSCNGARLGKLGREVMVSGKTILDVSGLNLQELLQWIYSLENCVSADEFQVFVAFSEALKARTSNLLEVGLDYLTLDRPLPSLSAGESQRVRLAGLLGSSLTGILYVLDEPTTGLHPHDTAKLLRTLRQIQENGNTVLVIEHDPEVIKNADYILEVGPGGGSKGGEIVAFGTSTQVMANPASLIGKYLSEKVVLAAKPTVREARDLTIRSAREHNLKNIDVSIPLGQLVVLTGASGSGKSTFLFDIVDKLARRHFNHANGIPGEYGSVEGLEYINRVVIVNQVTIGNSKSSRSNVATYTKLFDMIRDVFASLPEAKVRGFGAEAFSFNTSPERCENCNGAGFVEVDMAFMPAIETECPSCNGRRFSEALLTICFQGHSISSILDMSVNDALPIFKHHIKIAALLGVMQQVGLGYLKLGQSTSRLSGGEAQRIKLAAELCKSGTVNTLYLLDEPTTGLHPREVEKLLDILKKLVSRGNTVVVIEHNLDVMCAADWIIDFGPGGGAAGGMVVAVGSPQEIMKHENSLTGQCLKTFTNTP